MDTFVVRVYRSEQGNLPDDASIRGVVEEISSGFQATFHDARELLAILGRAHGTTARASREGRVPPEPDLYQSREET